MGGESPYSVSLPAKAMPLSHKGSEMRWALRLSDAAGSVANIWYPLRDTGQQSSGVQATAPPTPAQGSTVPPWAIWQDQGLANAFLHVTTQSSYKGIRSHSDEAAGSVCLWAYCTLGSV